MGFRHLVAVFIQKYRLISPGAIGTLLLQGLSVPLNLLNILTGIPGGSLAKPNLKLVLSRVE
jgi:hypothetical protein